MTKKTNKKRRQSTPNVPVYTVPTTSGATGATASPAKPRSESFAKPDKNAVAAAVVDWQGEYGYVLSDLRNMLIVAAAMVVLLIALNFIIT